MVASDEADGPRLSRLAVDSLEAHIDRDAMSPGIFTAALARPGHVSVPWLCRHHAESLTAQGRLCAIHPHLSASTAAAHASHAAWERSVAMRTSRSHTARSRAVRQSDRLRSRLLPSCNTENHLMLQ